MLPAGANATPAFDERFTGYGKNKVQWVQALRSAGFHFWVLPRARLTPHPRPHPHPDQVLPRAYLLHYPHKMSISG